MELKKPAAEVVEDTITFLEENEWGKEAYVYNRVDGAAAFCLMGAALATQDCIDLETGYIIGEMNGVEPDISPFAKALGFDTPSEVYRWNDLVAQNKEEVIVRLTQRAKFLREQGE